jgi:1,4-alpha-glucan branching enzyme
MRSLIRDLNHMYRENKALHHFDFEPSGFDWIDCHDAAQSVLTFIRRSSHNDFVIVGLNFTPIPRERYRIGVPEAGVYQEILCTDSAYYGGSNMGNGAGLVSEPVPWMGRPHSIEFTLPPLAGVALRRTG